MRDLPDAISLRRMVGPSIILAGLALGSGEFIFWPYIVYKSQFIFFWACLLGVATQFFLNMEIARWTLATGESAITGFIRINRKFAGMFLLLNIIPWMIPAWAMGAAQILSWLIWGPVLDESGMLVAAQYDTVLAIAGMVVCGVVLTAGPVVYETLEKVQIALVALVLLIVVVLTAWLLRDRPDALVAQVTSVVTLGAPRFVPSHVEALTPVVLLGALAFAGAGGTTNLGQSNYVKDKGYGMGRFIGRITSPVTGRAETIAETGFQFSNTPENQGRWQAWWRRSNQEHAFSFLLPCLLSLVLLTLVSYILFYDTDGVLMVDAEKYDKGLGFIWGEAQRLTEVIGPAAKVLFLVMGIAILLTTEFGVLDVASRISSDIVKVAWLRGAAGWSESRLYYLFLWGTILLGSCILMAGQWGYDLGAFGLFKLTAAMNGGVMFLYSGILLYMNRTRLPVGVRIGGWRMAIMVWAVLFFGLFCVWAACDVIGQWMPPPAVAGGG